MICGAALLWIGVGVAGGQAQAPSPSEKPPEKAAPAKPAKTEKPQLPFQIQLLDTKIRFGANGDSRKEVHTIVKIINILGAQQFGRISFDHNRSFQSVEIPLVRVSHANGGTSEVLPSAVTDAPSAAANPFAAYRDVRVKAVRILGLQEGDTVEYRVITTTTNAPLAPDFWLEHTFDRSGQVLEEHYELDLPASRKIDLRVNPKAEATAKEKTGSGAGEREVYRWVRKYEPPKDGEANEEAAQADTNNSDVGLSTVTWNELSARLAEQMMPGAKAIGAASTEEETRKELMRRPEVAPAVKEKALELTREVKGDGERLSAIYGFVATKITTVDTPLGARGFRSRTADEVLNSGYGDGEEKYVLLAAMAAALGLRADAVLTGFCDQAALATPAGFNHLVVRGATKDGEYWLDPAVEVAPFGMISPTPAKCGLLLRRDLGRAGSAESGWVNLPTEPPFPSTQRVTVDAVLSESGQLSARVKYLVRGENELLLRVAFHQTPKEKWKDVAGLLSLSDGFRGTVTKVDASDPLATKEPFAVEYELSQLNFVDWKKTPVRIPALLPQIGLPDPPMAGATTPIRLGTPLDVQTSMTLHVPEGTQIQTPVATAVTREYASFTSKYAGSQNEVVATRHISFVKREIPADRAADYNAFLHAVQSDAAQRIVLLQESEKK
jgi:hypothetical protein